MKSTILSFILILIISLSSQGQELAPQFNVKYISNENIYIDAGLSDSIAVGDTLEIIKSDSVHAVMEVIFAAEHSASCRIIRAAGPIQVGDKARSRPRAREPVASELAVSRTPKPAGATAVIAPPSAIAKAPSAKISGGVSVQMHKWDDRSASNLDFTQPSFRLNLKASRLRGYDLSLNVRITSRYNKRTREYNRDVPRTEWRNRIYQLSFGYANDLAPFSLEVGRVISNKMSGIGYIDGMVMQKGIGLIHVGAFAGTQPEWQYSEFQTSLQKYGGYVNYTGGDYRTNRLESTVAAAGEYHGATVSREFLYLRNGVTLSGRWNFYQSAEIDFNRGWKKEKIGESVNLTNLYLSGRGNLAKWLSAGISYDNRRNYWTYDTRTLADSLFDDVLRKGLRADLSIRPHKEYFLFGSFGLHKRSVDQSSTYSYSFGINKTNLFAAGQSLNLQFAGFLGPFTDGYNLSARFMRTLWRGDMISVGYGIYVYGFGAGGSDRKNDWIQLAGQFDLYRKLYISATYEYDMGDDTKGNRVIAELGYRF
ncbi:MAG: hypothetical protein A2W25_03385 [candidate division Zixibacteria bacterium RBG_16_53_22]|nr:MAG: hypothetical protein A2W25_03385 [candidate division Zixibacteria bacterium RBG_16_53_22]